MKSTRKTTAAVVRSIAGETDWKWAEIMGKSIHTVRHLEAGTLKLSPAMATKMSHETGISLEWLMKGDPTAPIAEKTGKPYTREIYERTQAFKTAYDQSRPVLRNFDKLGFCARLIAILESASARRDYYLARYKVHTALDSLQREFGMDEKVYQHSDSYNVHIAMAKAALKEVLARVEEIFKQSHHPKLEPTNKRASKKRRR
jgi:plasmid maintenance system antidote protein VapI